MLTISQLAAYAAVTIRTVRHYHAKGLLPEPERDQSGYRRYDAAALVQLIKIRTLADAGVPLARVGALLRADEAELAAAVREIDARLRREIRERQEHRRRLAALVAGDRLVLPGEVVTYLDRLRALGASEEMIAPERDSWILVAARWPERIPQMMADKIAQLHDPRVVRLYELTGSLARVWDSNDAALTDPILAGLADLIHELLEEAQTHGTTEPLPPDAPYIQLLDSFADNAHPAVARLRALLADRGWTGWTRVEKRAARR